MQENPQQEDTATDTAATPETAPAEGAADAGEPTALGQLAEQMTNAESWIPEPLRPAWTMLQDYPLLRAGLIIIAGILLAYLVRWLVRNSIGRLASRTSSSLDDALLKHVQRPVFLTVLYAALAVSVISMGLSPGLTGALIRVLFSLIILIWMLAGLKISSAVINTLAGMKDRVPIIQPRTIPLFDITSKLLILLIGSYMVLQVWDIDATAWLASAGVVGIAVGFAAKDTLANLFSGVFILVDSPYKLGDYVNLDSGERGMVTHVGMRSTRLLTRDDVEITIPNAVIANAKIVNESAGRWTKRRIRIKVGAAYGTDLQKVCDTLMSVADGHAAVCKDPAARVRMRGFGDSALDFELLAWIEEPELRGKITHELLMAVYDAFADADIEIPYNKQDLYIKEFPERA
ncbi:MAG: mechanosensitive ion channel family protein [Pseudomonadota bacterium]